MRGFIFSLIFIATYGINHSYATDIKHLESELTDAVITAKITSKYTEHKHLNPLKINVSTDHHVVTLSGYVKDKAAMRKALQLAKSTKGVTAVEAKDLQIKQVNTAITDAYITTKVEGAILKTKILDDESIPLVGIKATTNNGVVTLTGEVKNERSIAPLLKRVGAVKGVTEVISYLQVTQSKA